MESLQNPCNKMKHPVDTPCIGEYHQWHRQFAGSVRRAPVEKSTNAIALLVLLLGLDVQASTSNLVNNGSFEQRSLHWVLFGQSGGTLYTPTNTAADGNTNMRHVPATPACEAYGDPATVGRGSPEHECALKPDSTTGSEFR
jgi:hypothetical protein